MLNFVFIRFIDSDFLPTEVTKFYEEMTQEEKDIVKEIAANHAKYETEEQVSQIPIVFYV